VRDLERDLKQIFDSYGKGDLTETDVDYCIVQLMTPENVDEVVAAFPDELRASFTQWLADPSFGDHPFLTNRGTFDIPEEAIQAARDWARRNKR